MKPSSSTASDALVWFLRSSHTGTMVGSCQWGGFLSTLFGCAGVNLYDNVVYLLFQASTLPS
eukprot:scaffold244794_cov35-Attheya_sp.AAC.1